MTNKWWISLTFNSSLVLSLLVENQGRICYGKDLKDFKGILSSVYFDGKVLNGTWTITGYPLQTFPTTLPKMLNSSSLTNGPILYGGHFILRQKPFDTFLNPIGWGKGYAWINDHNIGRYWTSLGPQVTLYVPGVWLRPAPALNHIRILELEHAPDKLIVEFIDYPNNVCANNGTKERTIEQLVIYDGPSNLEELASSRVQELSRNAAITRALLFFCFLRATLISYKLTSVISSV